MTILTVTMIDFAYSGVSNSHNKGEQNSAAVKYAVGSKYRADLRLL